MRMTLVDGSTSSSTACRAVKTCQQ